MSLELRNRIITSIALFLFIYISVFINSYITIIFLIIISFISWLEFTILTNKVYRKKNEIIANLILILSFFYVTIFAGVTYYFIYIDNIYFFYILLICAFSDIGGYVFGKIFKGKKLTDISPNKTISGSLGSLLFSLVPYFLFKVVFIYSEIEFFAFVSNNLSNILICIYLSLICQMGDLFISYFKRLSDVKDTGKILPGHGGLLDRIDGIIFAIPALAILGYLLNSLGF
tara:strand:+ start:204 stop:893 length:690 start_codon:yes stop_codon:yes gene_type:complete